MKTETSATKTQDALKEMLTENTGRHMLDSGGAYGRNWEMNQGIDFDSQPTGRIEWHKDGPEVTLNLYHWLSERLGDYRDDLTAGLYAFGDKPEHMDESWPETLETWLESRGITSGIIGENSYNGESVLSQVIQWWQWTETDADGFDFMVVALQIHGGCDVRGGYTAPRIFEVYDEYALVCSADATIYCKECHASWYTDDSWNWYANEELPSLREDRYNRLGAFPIIQAEELTESQQMAADNLTNLDTLNHLASSGRLRYFTLGFVQAKDGNGICPVCGHGALDAV